VEVLKNLPKWQLLQEKQKKQGVRQKLVNDDIRIEDSIEHDDIDMDIDIDVEFHDHMWLDVFGEVAKEYLTHHVIPHTNAGCWWDPFACVIFNQSGAIFTWDEVVGRESSPTNTLSVTSATPLKFDSDMYWEDELFQLWQAQQAQLVAAATDQDAPCKQTAKQALFHTVKVLKQPVIIYKSGCVTIMESYQGPLRISSSETNH
jgi:hypothetical protein